MRSLSYYVRGNNLRRIALVLFSFIALRFYLNSSSSSTATSPPSSSSNPHIPQSISNRINTKSGLPFPLNVDKYLRETIPQTTILSHAPGFTVFRNLYFKAGRYHILTDSPYEFPNELDHIVSLPEAPENPVQLWGVRGNSIMMGVPEKMLKGEFLLPEDALDMFRDVETIDGITFINNDHKFVNHFYHWIGETFIGGLRAYLHAFSKNSLPLPTSALPTRKPDAKKPRLKTPSSSSSSLQKDGENGLGFDRFIFMNVDDRWYDIEDVSTWEGGWRDRQMLNEWYMEKLFPGTPIETSVQWNPRKSSGKTYLFSTVILADRLAGHRGPTSAFKPWGDAFRLDLPLNWLAPIRERLLRDHKGVGPLGGGKNKKKRGTKPVVTYISRQSTTRKLDEKGHRSLVHALEGLRDEGLVEYNLEVFENRTVEDQIAIMGRTDILVSVHGNGLTNSLFMNPGEHSGVFEFQPVGCRFNDFGPLAEANGIPHWIVNYDAMCAPAECGVRTCLYPENPEVNSDSIPVDGAFVGRQIRAIVKTGKPDYVPLPAAPW